MCIQNALKHHPQLLGLLFQYDENKETLYELAVEVHGEKEIFKVIQECIPTNTSLPILHHVLQYAPQHINDFCIRYPPAGHFRDEDGRTLMQEAIASASISFGSNGMLFIKMTDDEIAEVDPVTKQYPFLLAANDEASK
jgi:hypothetical protein